MNKINVSCCWTAAVIATKTMCPIAAEDTSHARALAWISVAFPSAISVLMTRSSEPT
jgi:hypothetical protein